MQDIKGHMMDIRTADGSIVKISAPGNGDQELTKTLGVEMVQNMYKVVYYFTFLVFYVDGISVLKIWIKIKNSSYW